MTYNFIDRAETVHQRVGLKPCPFCGCRNAVLVVQQIPGLPEAEDTCFIRCEQCFAQGPARIEEATAIRDWQAHHLSEEEG